VAAKTYPDRIAVRSDPPTMTSCEETCRSAQSNAPIRIIADANPTVK
jgi:hypothetical protein